MKIVVLPLDQLMPISTLCYKFSFSSTFSVIRDIREDSKKNSKKSDIVTIRSGTYLPYLNSDIKINDICLKTLYLPTIRK